MKPEDFRSDAKRPFNGQEYLKAYKMAAKSIFMASA